MYFIWVFVYQGIFAPVTKISKPGILVNHRPHSSPAARSYPKINTTKITARIDTGRLFFIDVISIIPFLHSSFYHDFIIYALLLLLSYYY